MSIDVAVIGCGYRGQQLISRIDAADSLNLVAVCDVISERVEKIRDAYPQVMVSTDCETVLNDSTIDAIAVATPASTHYPLVKKGLLCDNHVFVEVPMAMRCEEVAELTALSHETGRILMTDDTCLYNGRLRAIRQMVDGGEIGDLFYIDAVWVNLDELDGMGRSTGFYPDAGVIWDLAPHGVAMMTRIADSPPRTVSATGSAPFAYCATRNTIIAWCHIVYENGVHGHIHVSWLTPEPLKRMVIAGSKQMIVYDELRDESPVTLYDKGVELLSPSPVEDPALVLCRAGEIRQIVSGETDPLLVAVNHFRDCILEGREPLSGGSHALRITSILEAAEQSISKGGEPVEVGSYSSVKG